MKTDLPVSNPPTVDDALRALERYKDDENVDDLALVQDFLLRLIDKATPESVIASDAEGFVLEGACQSGFDHIDDNADLLVVHNNDLIKYVMVNRRINKAANELKCLVEELGEMGIANAPFSSVDIVDFLCHRYPALKAAVS